MKRDKHRHNDDEKEDRLSYLPECVLLHILSFLNAKHAVQTCILSTRWNNLWKFLPTLRLRSSYFDTMDGFTQFIAHILSLRDDSTSLDYLRFTSTSDSMVEPQQFERIQKYAVSHNIQRLRIAVNYNIEHLPGCIFSCHKLTCLKLYILYPSATKPLFPNSLDLPALTNLCLSRFIFPISNDGRAEPFSGLKKLNSLTIRYCKVSDAEILCISSATLANLTIQTFQARNYRKIELSTPNLSIFAYGGTPFEKLCGSHLCSIKQVNIDAYMCLNYNAEPPSNLLSWLIELTEIKSLAVTATTLQVLSLVPDLLKVKFHSLRNLKSLRVKMEGISSVTSNTLVDGKFVRLSKRHQEEVANFRKAIFKEGSPDIPHGIVGFLLQNSPSAKTSYH